MAHNTTVNFFCDFDFDANAALKRLGLEPGGAVQEAIDDAVLRYSEDFVPFDSGSLVKKPWRASAIGDDDENGHLWDRAKEMNVPGSGEVIYPGPYATYLYYGEVYGPNIPYFDDDSGKPAGYWSPPGKSKHPTGRQMEYTRDKHPIAGPKWIEHMKPVHMKDIIAEAERKMKNG